MGWMRYPMIMSRSHSMILYWRSGQKIMGTY